MTFGSSPLEIDYRKILICYIDPDHATVFKEAQELHAVTTLVPVMENPGRRCSHYCNLYLLLRWFEI